MQNRATKLLSIRGIIKMAGFIIGGIVLIFAGLLLVLRIWSPGKIKPYLDENGNILSDSVAEITKVEIGGMDQGMIIKGKNVNNPIILFLHGGPGNPEYVFAKNSSLNLEDNFTVCWWEQRGTGMSYSSDIKPGTITLEQMISDTVEVTNYLRERFGKEKVYLMGHSWGSFLGIHVAERYPELYEAYIGIGQVTNQIESEKMGYAKMLEVAQSRGDTKSLEKLKQFNLADVENSSPKYLMARSEIMMKQGYGVFHKPISKFSLLLPIFQLDEYTLADKYGYAMGSALCLDQPINKIQFSTSLFDTINELKLPVYITHGAFDAQVSYQLSKEYFDQLQAPLKRFYTFDNSAHSPFVEEPDKFTQIMLKDVLGADAVSAY